ncbi:MAG: NADH:ubiquinone reductase (Na(+)-transporting) subunit C [Waddliaceae bacterium]
MSNEQQPSIPHETNFQVLRFVIILSLTCALILATLASALSEPQVRAQALDRSKEMMIAARVFTHTGHFQVRENGEYFPARYVGDGRLERTEEITPSESDQIIDVYHRRFIPFLVDNDGNTKTFEEAGIDQETYIEENRQRGYSNLPLKLIYKILPNPTPDQPENNEKPIGYVIPVNGMGLWDAIYGYIAIESDGETVIGISWYDQKETPGLGANIATEEWQENFYGKKIFQSTTQDTTELERAPIGINVVKGKVSETIGDAPKAQSAVDGMAGATITGTGVALAYKQNLASYRPFFIKLHQESGESNG